MARTQFSMMREGGLNSWPDLIIIKAGQWRATQEHARGTAHDSSSDACHQLSQDSAVSGCARASCKPLGEAKEHLHGLWMQPAPTADGKGLVLDPRGLKLVSMRLHALSFTLGHRDGTIKASTEG